MEERSARGSRGEREEAEGSEEQRRTRSGGELWMRGAREREEH